MAEPMANNDTDGSDGVRKRKTKADNTANYWQELEKWSESVRCFTIGCNMMAPGGPSYFGMPAAQRLPTLFNLPPPPVPPTIFTIATEHNIRLPTLVFAEYRIPRMWKRFVAEVIDFVLLFFFKLAITFVAVDFFELVDFNKYDLSALQSEDKIDYELAMEMTSELVVLECIHRIIVCFYEGLFLAQGDGQGGATPGKLLMGLRVISCEQVLVGPAPDIVRVSPTGTLTLRNSFLRALVKNLSIACIFPLPFCFPYFFNHFNRAGYDLICRSIVVEEARPFLRQ